MSSTFLYQVNCDNCANILYVTREADLGQETLTCCVCGTVYRKKKVLAQVFRH